MKRKADFIFIAVLGLLIVNKLVQLVMGNTTLSLNNYLGITLWLFAIALRFTNHKYGRHALVILLLLGTFNIANLGLPNVSFSVGFGNMEPIGFNPLLLLVLVIYYFVNKTAVKKVVKMMFFPSEEEQQEEQRRQTDFYLRKFENCSDAELEGIINNASAYPPAAQIAIREISKAREK